MALLPFIVENTYVKISKEIESISVDDSGSVKAIVIHMDYDINFKILEMVKVTF